MARRVLGVPDARRDSVVGRSDLVHVVEPVDQIGEASRVENHIDGVDVALLIDLDEPGVQTSERKAVLVADEEIPLRLEPEESREAVELALVQRQVALERREARGDGSGVGSGAGTGIGGSEGTGDGSGTVTGCGGSDGAGIGSGTWGGSTIAVGWT